MRDAKMEVYVNAPSFSLRTVWTLPAGAAVGSLLERFVPTQDVYVVTNGRRCESDEPLQHGSVYYLEPRLRGGKGGFGSMLRALGAQIEKTTNREACRDLSGRRLRDVNHEKEMAEWLKKQAEREAEKEQRRAERLQRKLSEPRHLFTDPQYQQQCHDLSERLEESVLKGLQASSSTQVKVNDVTAAKRPGSDRSQRPAKKKKTAASCFWAGAGQLPSSEEEDEEEEDDEGAEPESSCSSSPITPAGAPQTPGNHAAAGAPQTPEKHAAGAPETSGNHGAPETPGNHAAVAPETPGAPETSGNHAAVAPQTPGNYGAPETSRNHAAVAPETPGAHAHAARPLQTEGAADWADSDGSPQQLDVSLASLQELEALGLDALKKELMSRGLKCGGTLAERAARLYAVRSLRPEQIHPLLLAKPARGRRK